MKKTFICSGIKILNFKTFYLKTFTYLADAAVAAKNIKF